MSLVFQGVSHRFGAEQVLRDVLLEARAGEITCLLGASGSGKSTLLRLAAGLEPLQAGRILLDGETLAEPGKGPPPERRPVGLVFQDHVLFPHKTVRQNVEFGLRRLPGRERGEVARRCLRDVRLGELAERYPDTLSGGQQQRVALARALAPAPRVMLLDEPFANVDVTLRRALREDARAALRASGAIAVVVTHDPDEALELADTIAILGGGGIMQAGTPAEVWRTPSEALVAALFGQAQRLRGTVQGGAVATRFGEFPWQGGAALDGTPCDVVTRPSAVRLRKATQGAVVRDVRFLGDRHLVLAGADGETLRAHVQDLAGIAVGDRVTAAFDATGTFVYPATDAPGR